MNKFLKRIMDYSTEYSNREAVASDCEGDVCTYRDLWEASGKVYAYFLEKGLQSGDFVMITMPRTTATVVTIIGILRAGLAFVVADIGFPKQRQDYIYQECGCKLLIDYSVYEDMMWYEPILGMEEVGAHDACFAIYTSGTTGHPKGIIHEYGKLDEIMEYGCAWHQDGYSRFAFVSPFGHVVFMIKLITYLSRGDLFYIVSEQNRKDLRKLFGLIEREGLTDIFMPPSMARLCGNQLCLLQRVFLGGEAVGGLYMDGPMLINDYGSSEAAMGVASFVIDKEYARCPIGKNQFGFDIYILDAEEHEVPEGEKGEICIPAKYTKGYIGLLEMNKKVFRNGMYHTGDIGYRDQNGNIIITGRIDNVVNVNGNRVELEEIEYVFTKTFYVSKAIVKAFEVKTRTVFVLYFLKTELDLQLQANGYERVRNILAQKLPDYMIPSLFVGVQEFPHKENGKIDYDKLRFPEDEKYAYNAPLTDVEAQICEAMAEALGCDYVGRDDDFFELGGNSFAVMITTVNLENMNISFQDVYKFRTPSRLALCVSMKERSSKKKISKRNRFHAENSNNVDDFTTDAYISSFYARCFLKKGFDIKNVDAFFDYEINEEVDISRLQSAVNIAVKICPYVTYDIVISDGKQDILFVENDRPLQVYEIGKIRKYGEEDNNFHYSIVSCYGRKIRFSVSHLITDEYGLNKFISAVLSAYFFENDRLTSMRDKSGYTRDIMASLLPVSDGYKCVYPDDNNCFKIKESSGQKTTYSRHFYSTYSDIERFCDKNSVSVMVALTMLLGMAIQSVERSNEKQICIRMPVDTRPFFDAENSFQNASIPHVFLSMKPKALESGDTEKLGQDLMGMFAEQYESDYLAFYTNEIADFYKTDDLKKKEEIARKYRSYTNILVSYLGETVPRNCASKMNSVKLWTRATYPVMLYAYKFGNTFGVSLFQQFESDDYYDAFVQICEKYGIHKISNTNRNDAGPYYKMLDIMQTDEVENITVPLMVCDEKELFLSPDNDKKLNDKFIELMHLKTDLRVLIETACCDKCYTEGMLMRLIHEFIKSFQMQKLTELIKIFNEKNVQFLIFNFPTVNELKRPLTEDEMFRVKKNVTGTTKTYGDSELETQLRLVYGEDDYERYCNNEIGVLSKYFIGNESVLKDQEGSSTNVMYGKRVTLDTPENYKYKVYFLGPCVISGNYVTDEETIPTMCQRWLNESYSGDYKVENLGTYGFYRSYTEKIESLTLRENDLVIIADKIEYNSVFGNRYYDLTDIYTENVNLFFEKPIHMGKVGTRLAWEAIRTVLREWLVVKYTNEIVMKRKEPKVGTLELQNYKLAAMRIQETEDLLSSVNGAIVMNCNPFTKGHRYLIEEAKKQCDNLLIFCVSEEKSTFSYRDRLEMLRAGISDLKRVFIIEAGNLVLSSYTLPEYFNKENQQDIKINPFMDLTLFAKYITPIFHISIRFVGSEPMDKVTKQYNLAMKEILPDYGLQVVEIERISVDGTIVSASLVRKMIAESRTHLLNNLCSESTVEYLKKNGYIQ